MIIKHTLPNHDKNEAVKIVENYIHIYSESHLTISRVIDSELVMIELNLDKPITVAMISRLSKLDDSDFKSLSNS